MSTLTLEKFRQRFDELVVANEMTWKVLGFLTENGKGLPFGTDTKVISTAFEIHAGILIRQIAKEYGYIVEGSPQTIYPDFTLTPVSGEPLRIAIDIKSTYRKSNKAGKLPIKYTLGSYTSFLRKKAKKNKKNKKGSDHILYPHNQYDCHWVVGFLYTRTEGVPAKVYACGDSSNLKSPYCDVEYFVQEKYKIVGTTPGSGNTANIGSHPTDDIDDLRKGRGPFAIYGKELCDEYWRHYERTADCRPYSNLPEFLTWKSKQLA